ncbi:MAG: hypothetical protein ACXIVQ_03365 [Acidimicrobiales bacterium]
MIEHDRPLRDSLPGIEDLPGTPSHDLVGGPVTKHLDAIGEQTWAALGDLTPSQILSLPHMGQTRLDKLVANVVGLLGAPPVARSEASADPRVAHALTHISSWAVGTGKAANLLDAVLAASHDTRANAPRHAIELLRSIEVETLADPGLVRNHDPVHVAQQIIESFDERERAILERTLDVDHDIPKLREIGEEWGVSHERIRQIQVKVERRLSEAVEHSDQLSLVAAARDLADRLGTAVPLSAIENEFAEFPPDLIDRLILYLAGPYKVRDGWVVAEQVDPLTTTVLDRFESLGGRWVPLDALHDALTEVGIRSEHHALAIDSTTKLRVLDDHNAVVDWRGSLADKAALVLDIAGVPMTMDELSELVEPNNARSLSTQVSDSDDIIRVGKGRFALASSGLDAFEGIVPAMTTRLRAAGGPLPVAALAEELHSEYGVSTNSITILASTHPAFVSADHNVRLRPEDDPYIPTAKLSTTARCYRVDGDWAWRIPVDHDILRGSGRHMPEAFAVHLGLDPLGRGRVHSPVGDIQLAWPHQPTIGSMRAAAHQLEAEEGDWMFVIASTASSLAFTLLRSGRFRMTREPACANSSGRPTTGSSGRPSAMRSTSWARGSTRVSRHESDW